MSQDKVQQVQARSIDAQIIKAQQVRAQENTRNINSLKQEAVEDRMADLPDLAAFNTKLLREKAKYLGERTFPGQQESPPQEAQKGEKKAPLHLFNDDTSANFAKEAQKANPELKANTLLILRAQIKHSDSAENIINTTRKVYPDPSLADDALAFLEASTKNLPINKEIRKGKERFNITHEREIIAGKNIATQARSFSQEGLGSPTALRDLYRDITGNPREPHALYDELSAEFPFKQMEYVINFLLHSLGSDLNSKGPSISPQELQRLLTDTRTLQAILGVYRFFQKRMKLIEGQFAEEDLTVPPHLDFEQLAKQLMKLLKERYPNSSKILKLALALGISEEMLAQIIIFSQYRDAMRNISPKLFKSERHRQDMLMSLIDTLNDLEDLLEEEEEGEEEEEEESRGYNPKDTLE